MTILFFKTNTVTDPGVEYEPAEVARMFWASDDAKAWLDQPSSGRLERLALSWVPTNIGSWDNRDDWDKICDAILAAMPRSNPKGTE
jgi:hypothetical protein